MGKFLLSALALLSFVHVSSPKAWALVCDPLRPSAKIGIVEKIAVGERAARVLLKNVRRLNVEELFDEKSYSIDRYVELSRRYFRSFQVLDKLESPSSQQVRLQTGIFDAADIDIGDVIIQGPPVVGACASLGFLGVLSSSGVLDHAVISVVSRSPFSYEGTLIHVSPRNQRICDSGRCYAELEYVIGDETFALSPGESYSPEWPAVESVLFVRPPYPGSLELLENEDGDVLEYFYPRSFNGAPYVIAFAVDSHSKAVWMFFLFLGVVALVLRLGKKAPRR